MYRLTFILPFLVLYSTIDYYCINMVYVGQDLCQSHILFGGHVDDNSYTYKPVERCFMT